MLRHSMRRPVRAADKLQKGRCSAQVMWLVATLRDVPSAVRRGRGHELMAAHQPTRRPALGHTASGASPKIGPDSSSAARASARLCKPVHPQDILPGAQEGGQVSADSSATGTCEGSARPRGARLGHWSPQDSPDSADCS